VKHALIADIHGNLDALNAVMDDLKTQNPDTILCLGDIVGYGAQPAECLKLVRDKATHTVVGNHDIAASGDDPVEQFNEYARAAILWTRSILTSSDRHWLSNLPMLVHLDNFTIVHSSLDNPRTFDYINSISAAARCFATMEKPLCFFAHTHIPIVFRYLAPDDIKYELPPKKETYASGLMLVNGGSVGQPRNHDPRAAYCVYDSTEQVITFHQVDYDVEAAAGKIREAGLPELLAFRLAFGV